LLKENKQTYIHVLASIKTRTRRISQLVTYTGWWGVRDRKEVEEIRGGTDTSLSTTFA